MAKDYWCDADAIARQEGHYRLLSPLLGKRTTRLAVAYLRWYGHPEPAIFMKISDKALLAEPEWGKVSIARLREHFPYLVDETAADG